MKKLILLPLLLLALFVKSQTITDSATLRSYINSVIVSNGTRSITGNQMNTVLNGMASLMVRYSFNSAVRVVDTLILSGPNVATVKITISSTVTDATITTSDITTNNSTTSKHGWLPKLSGNASQVLNGIGVWVAGGGGIDDVLASLQQLTAARKIRMGGQTLTLDSGQLRFTNMSDPAIVLDPFPKGVHSTQYILRAHTASASNNSSFEMLIDNNANGGPPDDNIFIQGWNIDSRTDNTLPSWTDRWEHRYTGSFYEHHEQWSSADNSRTYRLFSQTFVDHGGPDLMETHVQGSFNVDILGGAGNCFSVAGASSTISAMSLTSPNGAGGVNWTVDAGVNQVLTLAPTIGISRFIMNIAVMQIGGGNNQLQFAPLTATNLQFINSTNFNSFHWTGNNHDLTINYEEDHFTQSFSSNSGIWSDIFPAGGGYLRNFNAGGTIALSLEGPTGTTPGATVAALPLTVGGSTSLNIVSDGATAPVGGGVNSALRMIASVPAQSVGPYLRNTSSTGITDLFFENNRGSFANYMFFRLEGATATVDNGLFGITTAADWLMLASAGASNAGFLLGNLNATPLVFATNNIQRARFDGSVGLLTMTASRFAETKGASVASAGDLTLGTDGNTFHITGTTTINAITTANWQDGAVIALIFDGSLTVKNNTAGGGGTAVFKLNGGVDFSATADDQLVLKKDGARWLEQSRSVN